MSNDQPANKRKRHLVEELEGTSTSTNAPIQQSFANDIPSWSTFEYEQVHAVGNEQNMSFTSPAPRYPINQPPPQQPHQLAPPSEGLDLSNVLGGSMNLDMNTNQSGIDPVYHNSEWIAMEGYLDQPPPDSFNTASSGHFQPSYQAGFDYGSYPMQGSQEDLRDPDQPGPSQPYYDPQYASQYTSQYASQTLFFADDLSGPGYEEAPKETKTRVRNENKELLEDWKDKNWKSNGWKKLEEHCIENFGCLPPPPPPTFLYERKKNGRKMHAENELDPYFDLNDKDALTLMEGKRRGNEMLKTGITKWHEAMDKQEAAKLLWKEILGRVINNRQSTDVKSRTTSELQNFCRETMQVCDATRQYRDILARLINGQMRREDAQRDMISIDQTIFMPYEEGRDLLSWMHNFADKEINKKPVARQKTMPKDEKDKKDQKKK